MAPQRPEEEKENSVSKLYVGISDDRNYFNDIDKINHHIIENLLYERKIMKNIIMVFSTKY